MSKKAWKPEDWWCNKCDFKIFGTKDKCFKCGLLKNQWCCKVCKYVSNKYFNKCLHCGEFYSKNGEYYWKKENGGLDEFINQNPEYETCHCRICGGTGPLRSCYNY